MRVIGGEFRSRRLKIHPGSGDAAHAGPSARDAVQRAGAAHRRARSFLDAYAGTGAVGIEALSRGARRCVFVEKNRGAVAVIRENLAALGLESRAEVFTSKAAPVLERVNADIVFLDPPYESEKEYVTALAALGALQTGKLVIVQHASLHALPEQAGTLRRYRVLKQGNNSLSFYSASV